MVHERTLCVFHKVCRVGNIMFTRCVAEVMLRFMLQHDGRLKRCLDLCQTPLQPAGNEHGHLAPVHPKTMPMTQLRIQCFSNRAF